ncbi:hypothetical protein JHK85_048656 [Glycine max]|nr:hypothetical protein JHK85_048656 [Glycine max]
MSIGLLSLSNTFFPCSVKLYEFCNTYCIVYRVSSADTLPKPCVKVDAISIQITEDEYQQGLLSCKNNLHDRLILPKGPAPVKVNDLKEKLSKLGNPIA